MASSSPHGPLRVGIGGPVGSGKTALMEHLCKRLREHYDIAAITNDIYTKEDAEFLARAQALSLDRIMGVETGGCPHTAIREDSSINLAAIEEMKRRFPALDLILIELGRRQSRGDLLARARRSHDLCHRRGARATRSRGRAVPASRAPTSSSSTRSILRIMSAPTSRSWTGTPRRMRGQKPFIFTELRKGQGAEEIATFIERRGGLAKAA